MRSDEIRGQPSRHGHATRGASYENQPRVVSDSLSGHHLVIKLAEVCTRLDEGAAIRWARDSLSLQLLLHGQARRLHGGDREPAGGPKWAQHRPDDPRRRL